MTRHGAPIGLCIVLALATSVHAVESSYAELGFLPGYGHSNFPTSMADDGSAVVGYSVDENSNRSAYLWRRETGIAPLSSLIASTPDNLVISGDGDSIFVNQGLGVSRWMQNGGLAPLFTATAGSNAVTFAGSSSDGRTLAGLFYADGPPGMGPVVTSYVWREGVGVTTISDGFLVTGVSPDGNYLIGNRTVNQENALTDVVRRSIGGSETVVDSYMFANGTAVSGDGSVVIGNSYPEGFRWTAGGTSLPIGKLPMQGDATSPLDVSFDGSVVVGYAEGAPQGAFIWDPLHGMQSIHGLLTEQGVDVSNTTFIAARFVSADGRTVLGSSFTGVGEGAWIATVVPEPGAFALASIAGPILLLRRRLRCLAKKRIA